MENNGCLFVGFKGKRNSSFMLVRELLQESRQQVDGALKSYCLLTNSFEGVRRNIEAIEDSYNFVIMFGCDKNLEGSVRLERFAQKDGIKCETALDIKLLSETLSRGGIRNVISDVPTHYLCNEAYWYALQKFESKVMFIHIPTLKNIDESFISKMKELKNYGIMDGTLADCGRTARAF